MLDYPGPDDASIRGQWQALEDMAAAGTTRSLAVSNFSPKQLDAVLSMGKGTTVPTVNQLPYGVGFSGYYGGRAADVVEENRKRGVAVQAWSPLQRALRGRAREACAEIGEPGRDRAEICADWWAAAACLLERIRSFEPRWAVLPLVSCAIQIRCCAGDPTRHAARRGDGGGAAASVQVCRVRVRAVEWPRRDDGTLQLGGRRRWMRCWRR